MDLKKYSRRADSLLVLNILHGHALVTLQSSKNMEA